MRYFLDTEFIERGRREPIQLISIGIVAEDGREFYAISSEFYPIDASKWVFDNVLQSLGDQPPAPIDNIANDIREFIGNSSKPEFWGYYADYDWVVFAQLFGTMLDLPTGFPMYCRDIKQWCDQLGNPKLPKKTGEHNALNDARWNKAAWEFLTAIQENV